MSHVLEILVSTVPGDDRLAWVALSSVRAQRMGGPCAAVLAQFHDILVAVHPCLSNYLADDPTIDECPWTDARLSDGFDGRMAVLSLRETHLDHVLDFIVVIAGALGLTVFDKQRGQIHRPPALLSEGTYQIHVHGIRPGFTKEGVVTRIARVFPQNATRIRRMLDTPRVTVKKGADRLSALRCQAMLSKLGCCCSIVAEQPAALRPAAEISLAGGNHMADLERLRRCAGLGNADSQYQLGFLLLHGLDFAQDSIKGVKWIEKAAVQGHGEAQWTLSLCYRDGNGVFKSYARALEWMRKAAEKGCPQAQVSVGRMYYKGEGTQPDLFEARHWFGRAAAQGDSHGQYWLGRMLQEGHGGARDDKQATVMFIRAAQLGNLDARMRLPAC